MVADNQLTLFELKTFIIKLLNKINSVDDIKDCLTDFDILDAQEDRAFIAKILFKELVNAKVDKISVICFMLERYVKKDVLVAKLWESLKNQNLTNEVKIVILNLLRDLDSDWSYETCEEYVDDAQSLLDENTKQLLDSAIINPEVQIDFMDFLQTLRIQDKLTLIHSFEEDYTQDILANILIPVFVSNPNSLEGKEALKILADTKSQLAFHELNEMQNFATGDLLQGIKKSLSTIKIAGIREDNTEDFYRKILADSKPKDFYITYPDGLGNCALIFTRETKDKKIRFVSIVINIETGIKDCFGFFEISEFECSKILERFLKNECSMQVAPGVFKTVLYNSELKTLQGKSEWKLPYEYVCWKTLLIDINYEKKTYEELLSNISLNNEVSLEKLYKSEVCERWFLDYEYSDEYQELLSKLKDCDDLEKLLSENLDNIFTPQEKKEWTERLVLSAYLKLAIGKDSEAQNLLSISKDDKFKNELFLSILKRSVYEYLMIIKYDKNIEKYGLTHEQIKDKIEYIESKWVSNG